MLNVVSLLIPPIPLSPNHSLTTDDIGPPIALAMVVIMISPLIWGYKYGELGKGKGGLRGSQRNRE